MATSYPDNAGFAKPWQEFIAEFGGAPLLHGPLDNVFKGWEELLSKLVSKYDFPGPDTSVEVRDLQINDNGLTCRIYKPPNATGTESLGVYIHGGGWAMGDLNGEDAQCRLISKKCNMVLLSVDYRLAPKHKYPAALDDCTEAAKWALRSRRTLEANDAPITLIGASAGGGLAFSTALRLIDDGLAAQITGVAAMVPVTVHPNAVPSDQKAKYTSYEEHAEHTVNTKSAMEAFFEAYGAPPDDKYTSCLLHSNLKHLRRAYIVECGTDTLRDDARLMQEKLESLNVPVKYDSYPGYPHYWWTFPSKVLADHQRDFFGNLIQGVNWVSKS
ncbi:hypothetical protein LTR10_018688 [Elasticomyces elasticus]|uniref:Alpha/beta hydrolase fold-3 domain-containing protein n=1 Tax=Exophiala sideris TaxID=1016849 RepID=A0ABR0JSG6_9EURO|nr:hypothetical protein LTR10_018688 [Elasticomyces elasticus]KAK5040435.1 hypothetical protein LTS07_000933 [Exophiala sideris]KAK5068813.1 hypothetical protein LTR69_000934 [Exophiala sideris]KAK5186410.1 hypothetical protein LTR44_001466 [Eurotiomycetes sp. CCFEE 6388]